MDYRFVFPLTKINSQCLKCRHTATNTTVVRRYKCKMFHAYLWRSYLQNKHYIFHICLKFQKWKRRIIHRKCIHMLTMEGESSSSSLTRQNTHFEVIVFRCELHQEFTGVWKKIRGVNFANFEIKGNLGCQKRAKTITHTFPRTRTKTQTRSVCSSILHIIKTQRGKQSSYKQRVTITFTILYIPTSICDFIIDCVCIPHHILSILVSKIIRIPSCFR